jgi:hexosaminidase
MTNVMTTPIRLSLGFIIFVIFVYFNSQVLAQDIELLPKVESLRITGKKFTISDTLTVSYPIKDEATRKSASWLQEELFHIRKISLNFQNNRSAFIQFIRVPKRKINSSEGYKLSITPRSIKIYSSSDAGLFYGAVSLLQLLTPNDGKIGSVTLPSLIINDTPRFPWRGLMLDSARHYQSVDFIKSLLDQMSRYKLNILHWHLCDDQGWRLEIKHYPKLTEIGSQRLDLDPNTDSLKPYGGFYNQDEIRAIVAYAQDRHITVVPEIEIPGHASSALLAYPQFSVYPVKPETLKDWGVFQNLYMPSEETITFLKNILEETMSLFPAPYLHIGGDEVITRFWHDNPQVQDRIKVLGLKDEHQLQGWFIQQIEPFLSSHGRRLIGWDEILDNNLSQKAIAMSWHGLSKVKIAADRGNDVILSPGNPFYFDNWQFNHPDSPSGRAFLISLEMVYRYDPTPKNLSAKSLHHILGLQGNLWSEHISTDASMEYMAFPRAAALAELGWSQPSHQKWLKKWPDFLMRLQAALKRDETFSLQPAPIKMDAPPSIMPDYRDNHHLKSCKDDILLNLASINQSTSLVNIIEPCWIWNDVNFHQIDKIDIELYRHQFNFQLIDPLPQVFNKASLEIHLDQCEGALIADYELPDESLLQKLSIKIPPLIGSHTLCIKTVRREDSPLWLLHSIFLERGNQSP